MASADEPVPRERTVATSVLVALRVPTPPLAGRLPAPWQVEGSTFGPTLGANLNVVFQHVLLREDGEGRPLAEGAGRSAALMASARHPESGERCSFNVRTWAANPSTLPGPYRTGVRARFIAERHLEFDGERGVASELVVVEPASGGRIRLDLRHRPSVPTRIPYEATVRSAADATIVRRYKVDQLVEAVLSRPARIDWVERYQLQVDVPELRDLFDGSEETVAIGFRPMLVRQVYEP
jgi:hypothetical protein